MEIFFSVLCAIFAVISSIFGVRNRIHSSKSRTGSSLRDVGTGYNESLSRDKRLDQLEEQLCEYSGRGDKTSERLEHISSRIRKREPETSSAK